MQSPNEVEKKKDTGFNMQGVDLEKLEFEDSVPIQTQDIKTDENILGIYRGKESLGHIRDNFGEGTREAFVQVFEDPQTKNLFQVWDKAGLTYCLKTNRVQIGELVRITRLVDVQLGAGMRSAQYKVARPKLPLKRKI